MNKKYDETVNDLTSELKYVQNQLNEKEVLLKKADQQLQTKRNESEQQREQNDSLIRRVEDLNH